MYQSPEAAFHQAQLAHDNELPEDRPDIRSVLSGDDTSREGTTLYEELDGAGKLRDVILYLADDFETRSELLCLICDHAEPDSVLGSTFERLIKRLAS